MYVNLELFKYTACISDIKKSKYFKNRSDYMNVIVNSTICNYIHKINGKVEGKKMIIDINTPCKKVSELSHIEVPVEELYDTTYTDNQIFQKAKEVKLCSTCLIPCGIMHICRLELGTMSKNLVKKTESLRIDFE